MSQTFPRINRQTTFYILVLFVIVFNATAQFKELKKLQQQRKLITYRFWGDEYKELPRFLKGVHKIGHFTDRDLLKEKIAGVRLAQAQLMLVPTVIDPERTDYEFVLVECTTPHKALAKLKELHLKPVFLNPKIGVLLGKKEK